MQSGESLFELVQETLRGPSLVAAGFYDQREVIRLLDALPGLDVAARTRADAPLMSILSFCLLQEQYRL